MPVQVQGEVLSIRKVGAYHAMTVVAPGMAELARPGHFVAVQVGGPESSMLLRRAFAIYDVKERGVYGGTVEFVFAVHGKGTAWLAAPPPQDKLDVVGPLGKPFRLPARAGQPRRSSAAATAARRCSRSPRRCTPAAAGSTSCSAPPARTGSSAQLDAKRIAAVIAVTTDDGSHGRAAAGSPTSSRQLLDRTGSDVVYACGPMAMLRAVSTWPPSAASRARSPSRSRWPAASACA